MIKYIMTSFVIACFCFASCQKKMPGKIALLNFDKYSILEEPSGKEIANFKFYFLLSDLNRGNMMLSIRTDSNNRTFEYLKIFDPYNEPLIENPLKFDTVTFKYLVNFKKLDNSAVDSIRKFWHEFDIGALKDSIQLEHTGGQTSDIVLFDNGIWQHKYRSFGSRNSIEKSFIGFIDKVKKQFGSK